MSIETQPKKLETVDLNKSYDIRGSSLRPMAQKYKGCPHFAGQIILFRKGAINYKVKTKALEKMLALFRPQKQRNRLIQKPPA